ncbi:major facilitator superfamily domain-containing protein [Coniochaeta sp. 2T2.1]|nr:major facilitator superfamily domain-containing protein [Coniochaeta sp. 2T2.1]
MTLAATTQRQSTEDSVSTESQQQFDDKGEQKEQKTHGEKPSLVTSAEVRARGEKPGDVEALGSDTVAPAGPRAHMSTLKWILTLISIYISSLLYGLDTTIVADVQGTILERFGEPEKLAWIGAGFPLGSIAVVLAIGKLYGTFDMKWLYFISLLTFETGSAICGAAPTMNASVLIVGRVIAGAGGSGFYVGALNIVTTLTDERERPMYIASMAMVWGTGLILGPVVGGALSQSSATWRWSFYLNLVIFGVFSPIYVFILPSLELQPGKRLSEKLRQIDWIGSLLNAAIWATWVVAITFGGATWAWSDGRTIATFVVCGVLIIVFGLQQRFKIGTTHESRIFPAGFLLSKDLLLQHIVTSCTAVAVFVPMYYIPLFFQFTRNDGPLDAAVRLLPFVIFLIFFSLVNGGAMPQFGYYQPWFIVSSILIIIGGALMFTVHSDTSNARVYGYSILIGTGAGLSFSASYSVAPIKVASDPRFGIRMIADGIGFINMAQIGSIVHALAISGTVFQNLAFDKLKSALAGFAFSDAELHAAISGTRSQLISGASEEVRALAVGAIIEAMDRVYVLVIVAGALCLVCSVLMKWEKFFLRPQ